MKSSILVDKCGNPHDGVPDCKERKSFLKKIVEK